MTTKACLIIGAGDDTGAAIARAFAAEGYAVCLSRRPRHADKLEALATSIRDAGRRAHAFPCDARDEEAVSALVSQIEDTVGPIEVAIFNIGANVRFSITETTSRVFQKVWEMACFAGFLMGREVAKPMLTRGRGTILFTGASAGVKGFANSAPFAMGKFAQRGLAQSMARELHPQGVHVAWVNIDGGISNPARAERTDDGDDRMLDPDAIAAAYMQLIDQHRSTWSNEITLRPWVEMF